MDQNAYDVGEIDIAWCPGCGNFGILNALKQALAQLDIRPDRLVMVSGIGQAAKTPHYLRAHVFNGLHGRALPAATAIKAANPHLTVVAESGDGCMYGEGGNHFIHAIRRNPDLTHIVHNNMVYGLTKGQASPTSQIGFRTPTQTDGVFQEPLNPTAVAIALDASFVARAFAGDVDRTREILKAALHHKGYALVDVLQPCVSYNAVNSYAWFKEHTYSLEDSYDPGDRVEAFRRATQGDKWPLGILYLHPRPTFEDSLAAYAKNKEPLHERDRSPQRLSALIEARRSG